ncbi:ATPase domain-containing protein [Aggregatilinea lenta]|uniref:ATPase domain-containing protein n=1 Tax=Aggregatilinea lenta TaxID=913108 RepID=UPI000E5AD17B|nr:ATPase domain-containing protein [Aggregatilinea lenta]
MTASDTTPKVKKSVISSGNEELDSKMGGGLPVNSLVLIEGGSGSGKSVLSQQIVWGSLQDGFSAAVFTSENTVKSLVKQMQSIDLDVLDHLLLGVLRIYPIELSSLGDLAPTALLQAMQHEKSRDVIVIDSFTSAIIRSTNNKHTMRFFEGCKRLSAEGVTVIIVLHSDAIDPEHINSIRSMCDAHLQLRSEQDGQRLVKLLQVAKIRGAASSTGAIVGFEVEPGWGMRVIPISKARG